VVPIARRLTIEMLTERTCKWPIGDPGNHDFHFCGTDSLDGVPYCEYHSGLAYQTPDPRRRLKKPGYA
jgi:GcrA cell cycle regulator